MVNGYAADSESRAEDFDEKTEMTVDERRSSFGIIVMSEQNLVTLMKIKIKMRYFHYGPAAVGLHSERFWAPKQKWFLKNIGNHEKIMLHIIFESKPSQL